VSPRLRGARPAPDERLPELPTALRPDGRLLDARLHLLDRQLLDVADVPVCTIDDLEIQSGDGGEVTGGAEPAFVTNIVTGPVLETRVFGGRPPSSRWVRIPWRAVIDVDVTVKLGVRGETLDATWVQRWLRDHVIGRMPGGRHDPG
jgi:hypothetical protein